MECYTAPQNVMVHPTMFIMTAWLAPCIVVAPYLRMLVKVGLLTTMAYIICLLSLGPVARQMSPSSLVEYPSFLHCLTSLDNSSGMDS